MIHINLLPWRETLKKRREKQFYISLAGSAFLAILILYSVNSYIDGLISQQNIRNSFLTQQTNIIDQNIAEIAGLEKKKQSRIELMKIIQKLQHSRPEVVRLFDELADQLPRGIYLTLLEREEKQLTLEGIAKSNARISAFMRNLDESTWFSNPKLHVIDSSRNKFSGASGFTLTVSMISDELNKEIMP